MKTLYYLVTTCILYTIYYVVYHPSTFIIYMLAIGLIYVAIFVQQRKEDKQNFIFKPPYIFAIYTFIFQYLGGIYSVSANIENDIFASSIIKVNFLALMAVTVNFFIFDLLDKNKRRRGFDRKSKDDRLKNIKDGKIIALFVISLIASLVLIRTGTFGFTASEDGGQSTTSIQILNYFGNLSSLAIVLWLYKNYKTKKSRLPLYIIIAVQALLGIVYAHKSQVLMPFLYAFLVIYSFDRKIKWKYVGLFFGVIFLAYAIIEPFRYYTKVSKTAVDLSSISSITKNFSASREYDSKVNTATVTGVLGGFLDRIDYTRAVVAGVEFSDLKDYYHPNVFENTFFAPIYMLPRSIIFFKPKADFTEWFAVNVMHSVKGNHMSPLTYGYFYMAGRELGILIGFLINGALQFLFYRKLYMNPFYRPLYFTLLLLICNPGAEYWAYIVTVLQVFTFTYVIYNIFFKYKYR